MRHDIWRLQVSKRQKSISKRTLCDQSSKSSASSSRASHRRLRDTLSIEPTSTPSSAAQKEGMASEQATSVRATSAAQRVRMVISYTALGVHLHSLLGQKAEGCSAIAEPISRFLHLPLVDELLAAHGLAQERVRRLRLLASRSAAVGAQVAELRVHVLGDEVRDRLHDHAVDRERHCRPRVAEVIEDGPHLLPL